MKYQSINLQNMYKSYMKVEGGNEKCYGLVLGLALSSFRCLLGVREHISCSKQEMLQIIFKFSFLFQIDI